MASRGLSGRWAESNARRVEWQPGRRSISTTGTPVRASGDVEATTCPARPLTSHEVIVQTIAATTTSTGQTVHAELDETPYAKGIKIPTRS